MGAVLGGGRDAPVPHRPRPQAWAQVTVSRVTKLTSTGLKPVTSNVCSPCSTPHSMAPTYFVRSVPPSNGMAILEHLKQVVALRRPGRAEPEIIGNKPGRLHEPLVHPSTSVTSLSTRPSGLYRMGGR